MRLQKARGDITVSSKKQTPFTGLKATGTTDIKAMDEIQTTSVMILGFLNQMLLRKGYTTAKNRSNTITARQKMEAVVDTNAE